MVLTHAVEKGLALPLVKMNAKERTVAKARATLSFQKLSVKKRVEQLRLQSLEATPLMSVQAFQRGARESHESIGHGVGLRPSHYTYVLENSPPIDWFEVISENFIGLGDQKGGRPSFVLEQIRAKYPIVLHGVSLSIGSVDPLNQDYLDKLKELIHQI
ncbi:MAG: DUF692 family multinuclear iron-containing protein, partial [Bdellovibrionales bacterium]